MNKKLTIGLAIIALLIVIGVAYVFSNKESQLAAAGISDCGSNTCLTSLDVMGTIVNGGVNSTSTTATSQTLVQNDIQYSLVSITPNVGALTLTMPASSTLSNFLPNAGDTFRFAIHNATTTAAATITVAAGTGFLRQMASTTAAIPTLGLGSITVTRKVNTDLVFTLGVTQ